MSPRRLGSCLTFGVVLMAGLGGCASARRGECGKAAGGEAENEACIVEAGCSTCIFKMEGPSCTLAVRIDGRPYLVRGSRLDDHGDAPAPDGLCLTVRRARVVGRIEDDVFVAERFELLPADGKR
jgi:hypothetical protein